MDSVTQFLLGASITGAILGPKIGGRALLMGGLVATLPDLDVIPADNVIDTMTYHRGFSHSVFVQTAVAPLIAFAAVKFVKPLAEHWKLTLFTVWITLITHSLLDSLTTYGTQIFWPLNVGPPVAYPSIFIIDPVYTIMLLVAVSTLFFRRKSGAGHKLNKGLLLASTIYLSIGMIGHQVVKARAAEHPLFAGKSIHVQPTAFNILFWQVMGVGKDNYAHGMTSLFQDCSMVNVTTSLRKAAPPAGYTASPSTERLHWFTDGLYSYQERADGLTIRDLRLGYPPFYPFEFKIAERNGEGFKPVSPVQLATDNQDRAALLSEAIGSLVDECVG